MNERGISWKDAAFYSHMLPSLESPDGKRIVCRRRMARGGDAGGWWIRSRVKVCITRCVPAIWRACVIDDAHGLIEKAAAYRALLAREFAIDLEFAATLAKRVFLGSFMFSSVPARMIQFMRRSPRFRDLMQDLFAGTQPYLELKSRLLRNLNGTLQEVLMNLFLNRVS